MECLGLLFKINYFQPNLEVARQYLEKALSIREKHLGASHPETMKSSAHLGDLLISQQEYERAETLLENAWNVLAKQLGSHNNVFVGRILFSQGILYLKTNRNQEAEKKLLQSIQILRQLMDPDRTKPLTYLAMLYLQQKKWTQSEMLIKEALQVNFKFGFCGLIFGWIGETGVE